MSKITDLQILYTCPKDQKQYMITYDDCELEVSIQDCDICGYHRDIRYTVKCECGEFHALIFSDGGGH